MASGHTEQHAHPISMYAKNLTVLLILMLLTIYASNVHLGSLANNMIAMSIAVTKAVLVILFFMHVKYSTKLTQLWAMAGFIWFCLMMLILMDYGTRRWEPAPSWNNDPGSALPRRLEQARENPQAGLPAIRPRQQ